MQRRVVITGMGAITPLGNSPGEMFRGLLEGRSGVGSITAFDASTFPTRFAAEVKGFELGRYVREPARWRHARANTHFALAASKQALEDAGVDPGRLDPTRCGVYLGTGEGFQDFENLISLVGRGYREETRTLDAHSFTADGLRYYHAEREHEQELHTPAAHVAATFALEGPNYSCLTACAAGSQALGEAAELIRSGDADLMLAGGSHSMVHPLGVTGFNLLTALSTRNDDPQKASRPFDRRRDGFVLGEGAGMLVLEELEHARRRGATILAELTGYGATADAFRVTDCHPEGRGAVACVLAALGDARLNPGDVDYVNAHGTSTPLGDKVETLALKEALGPAARATPVSSTKSMLGHLMGASGAVELVICVLSLRQGVMAPTINYDEPDPDCDLDCVPNAAREKRLRHALSNSFGFGGQNVCLVVSAFGD
jgi:3-oxoacyl-[acyl-carrier-protein] synthase II